jgi:hypothetical protein
VLLRPGDREIPVRGSAGIRGRDVNLYAYAGSNPISRSDPNGEFYR